MFTCMNSRAVHTEVTHSLDWLQEEGILKPFIQTMEAISSEQEMN